MNGTTLSSTATAVPAVAAASNGTTAKASEEEEKASVREVTRLVTTLVASGRSIPAQMVLDFVKACETC
jgi:hypothetical protein